MHRSELKEGRDAEPIHRNRRINRSSPNTPGSSTSERSSGTGSNNNKNNKMMTSNSGDDEVSPTGTTPTQHQQRQQQRQQQRMRYVASVSPGAASGSAGGGSSSGGGSRRSGKRSKDNATNSTPTAAVATPTATATFYPPKVYVRFIPLQVPEADVVARFSQFGKIVSAVFRDASATDGAKCCYIEYETKEAVERAVAGSTYASQSGGKTGKWWFQGQTRAVTVRVAESLKEREDRRKKRAWNVADQLNDQLAETAIGEGKTTFPTPPMMFPPRAGPMPPPPPQQFFPVVAPPGLLFAPNSYCYPNSNTSYYGAMQPPLLPPPPPLPGVPPNIAFQQPQTTMYYPSVVYWTSW